MSISKGVFIYDNGKPQKINMSQYINRNIKVCQICGKNVNRTEAEHYVPRAFFNNKWDKTLKPERGGYIMSCSACNSKNGYLRECIQTLNPYLASSHRVNMTVHKKFVDRAFKGLGWFKENKPDLFTKFIDSIRVKDIFSKNGYIYLGKQHVMMLNDEVMESYLIVFRRIVRGLFFINKKCIVPDEYEIIFREYSDPINDGSGSTWSLAEDLVNSIKLLEIDKRCPNLHIDLGMRNEFFGRIDNAVDDAYASAYIIFIHGNLMGVGMVIKKDHIKKNLFRE